MVPFIGIYKRRLLVVVVNSIQIYLLYNTAISSGKLLPYWGWSCQPIATLFNLIIDVNGDAKQRPTELW